MHVILCAALVQLTGQVNVAAWSEPLCKASIAGASWMLLASIHPEAGPRHIVPVVEMVTHFAVCAGGHQNSLGGGFESCP